MLVVHLVFSLVKRICKLSKVVGSCDGYYPRWWHNYQTGKCEKFIYGGCEANENNFPSKDDCEETCPERDKDICKLPKGRELCYDFFGSWRYNYETGKCERMHIFGCGNANYFPSRDACVKACPEREQNICELPRDTGTCHGIFQRAWHNYETGRCERFLYTGCGGNANNFPSRIDCEKACPRKDCGRPSCDLFCPLGFKLDANNCPLCECKECPTTQVQCPVSPCSTAPKVCAGHPQARCINNYCGGCKALWFVGQLQVKCVCKPQQCDVICPLGYQTGDDGCPLCKCKCCDPNRGCRAYPCLFAKCRLFPNATCVEEFCTSSCFTPHWFNGTIEVNCECSRLSCEPCEFGYVVDDEGCETCKCIPGVIGDQVTN